jgi:WD40 repeat protein
MCPYTNTKKAIKRERDTAFSYDGHAEEVDASRPKGGEGARFEEACKCCNIEVAKEMLDYGLVTKEVAERAFYESCWELAQTRRNKEGGLHRVNRISKLVNLVDMLAAHKALADREETPTLPEELWNMVATFNSPVQMAQATELIQTVGEREASTCTFSETTDVSFSPCGIVASAGIGRLGKEIKLYSVETGELVKTFEATLDVQSVSFHPSGDLLAAGGGGETIGLYNVEGDRIKTLTHDFFNFVDSLSFSPSGDVLASGLRDECGEHVTLWDVETGKSIKDFYPSDIESHLSNHIYSLSFNPSSDLLAGGCYNGKIHLWDVETGEMMTLEGHPQTMTMRDDEEYFAVFSVSFSPSGDVLASGGEDGKIKLWRVETGELIKTLVGHSRTVHSVTFDPSGDVLASGSTDSVIKLWNVRTGQLIKTLKGSGDCHSLSFSPSGDVIVAGGANSSIEIYVAL